VGLGEARNSPGRGATVERERDLFFFSLLFSFLLFSSYNGNAEYEGGNGNIRTNHCFIIFETPSLAFTDSKALLSTLWKPAIGRALL
jgi:hypothetical protein